MIERSLEEKKLIRHKQDSNNLLTFVSERTEPYSLITDTYGSSLGS